MLELSVEKTNTLTICGDTHGIHLPFKLYLRTYYKVNFLMCLKYLEEMDILLLHIITSSTAIS